MKPDKKINLLALILFTLLLVGYSLEGYTQTLEDVRTYLEDSTDIKHKDIVLRQSILETGHYKSYSCRIRKNLFGFRYKGKYLEFNSWKESIDYYEGWQKRKYKGGDYFTFLKQVGYATDKAYVSKLKGIRL
mgnify:CR=1 FL=1